MLTIGTTNWKIHFGNATRSSNFILRTPVLPIRSKDLWRRSHSGISLIALNVVYSWVPAGFFLPLCSISGVLVILSPLPLVLSLAYFFQLSSDNNQDATPKNTSIIGIHQLASPTVALLNTFETYILFKPLMKSFQNHDIPLQPTV
ncbi:hypothetical protein C8Q75DRAFT_468775 [Abortiporus biennis]|nr:hypothetical protein C8Q75DRAFT_468775 [Abortiporus biennis]